MKKILWVLFMFTVNISFAQTEDSSAVKKKWKLSFTIDASNNYSYRSTVDSLSHPYIYPSLYLKTPNKFYFSVGAFAMGNDNVSALFTEYDFSAGKDFYIGKDGDASLGYTYSYINRNNELLAYLPQHDLYGSIGWDINNWCYTSLSADYTIGWQIPNVTPSPRKTGKYLPANLFDYYLTWELSKEFSWDYLLDFDDALVINPTLAVSGGTNNYYVKQYDFKRKKTDPNFDAEQAGFKLNTIGLSVPVSYYIGKWGFTFKYKLVKRLNTTADQTLYSLFKVSVNYRIL